MKLKMVEFTSILKFYWQIIITSIDYKLLFKQIIADNNRLVTTTLI